MKTRGVADWYLILMHGGDVKRYLQGGGDPSKAIIHHLTYDVGVINPLWGTDSFLRRVERIKAWGIGKVVAPDFSAWATSPVAVQMYNYYRSCVVSSDFVKAGLQVVPNVTWSVASLFDVAVGMWGERSFVVVDANHSDKDSTAVLERLFSGGRRMMQVCKPSLVWLYTANQKLCARWRSEVGECEYVPSRIKSLAALSKHLKRRKALGV